jgi:hypothetical protein
VSQKLRDVSIGMQRHSNARLDVQSNRGHLDLDCRILDRELGGVYGTKDSTAAGGLLNDLWEYVP